MRELRDSKELDGTPLGSASLEDIVSSLAPSVLIAVKDTGTGLDPAGAEWMFQAFFMTKADGIGMGLSICRSIIEAHGGRLWVSPRTPHGARVRFPTAIRLRRLATAQALSALIPRTEPDPDMITRNRSAAA
jgi:signal transduction histidine kinase